MNLKIFIILLFFSLLATPPSYCEEGKPPKHNTSELRQIVQEKTLLLEKFTEKLNAEISLIDKKIQEIKPVFPEDMNNLLAIFGFIYFHDSGVIVEKTVSIPTNETFLAPFDSHQEIIDSIISQRKELEKKWKESRDTNDMNGFFDIFVDFLELKRETINTW